MSRRGPREPPCPHTLAYGIRAEVVGSPWAEPAIVCRACGAYRSCPVYAGSWMRWTAPLDGQRRFPDGAAFTIVAGPSADHAALMRML